MSAQRSRLDQAAAGPLGHQALLPTATRRPIYFISATNFNLLGADEWVRSFKFINYIDCFDGQHPSVFVPEEIPHEAFESIEDINNYLLEHKAVADYVTAGAPARSCS